MTQSPRALVRRVLNVLLAGAAGCALSGAIALAQTVTLTDTGPIGSGTGPTYYAGDGWQISITSSYPNAGVDMCDPNGCTSGGFYGNTDSNGSFTLTGTFDPADNGSWSETWSVGGHDANELDFNVIPPQACDITNENPYASLTVTAYYVFNWSTPPAWVLDGTPSYTTGYLGAASSACASVTNNFNGYSYISASESSGTGYDLLTLTPNLSQDVASAYYTNDYAGYCPVLLTGSTLPATFTASGSAHVSNSTGSSVEVDVYGCFLGPY